VALFLLLVVGEVLVLLLLQQTVDQVVAQELDTQLLEQVTQVGTRQ
jgi:hypothetical protein